MQYIMSPVESIMQVVTYMIYNFLADVVVFVHFSFIVLVVFGGLVVLRKPRFIWVHLPILIWGVLIEFFGLYCPLTPLEKWLITKSGKVAYNGAFTDHYLLKFIYPEGLTRESQITLGIIVLVINLLIYYFYFTSRSKTQ